MHNFRRRQEKDETMPCLPFDGIYRKMPPGIKYLTTYLKDIGIVERKDIPEDEVSRDTIRENGTHYTLPDGKLIWIKLWTDCIPKPIEWITYRRFTEERYKSLLAVLGHEVLIQLPR